MAAAQVPSVEPAANDPQAVNITFFAEDESGIQFSILQIPTLSVLENGKPPVRIVSFGKRSAAAARDSDQNQSLPLGIRSVLPEVEATGIRVHAEAAVDFINQTLTDRTIKHSSRRTRRSEAVRPLLRGTSAATSTSISSRRRGAYQVAGDLSPGPVTVHSLPRQLAQAHQVADRLDVQPVLCFREGISSGATSQIGLEGHCEQELEGVRGARRYRTASAP